MYDELEFWKCPNPEAIAFEYKKNIITYKELNEKITSTITTRSLVRIQFLAPLKAKIAQWQSTKNIFLAFIFITGMQLSQLEQQPLKLEVSGASPDGPVSLTNNI